jgi:drug/metabolite transporter (DMT)-like permease
MAENTYWFARRFPVGHPRNSMSPVTPEGFRVAWTFVWWMVGGAAAAIVLCLLAAWLGASSGFGPLSWVLFALAPIVFVGCAAYGAWYFITTAMKRGDTQHTIDDYKNGRVT